jgi:Immunity protein 7
MFEYHGWVTISDTPGDGDELRLQQAVDLVQRTLAALAGGYGLADLRWENGRPMLHVAGSPNHAGRHREELGELMASVGRVAPGSYGLLYFHDDEDPDPERRNAFRVLRLARGRVSEHPDPFLSPVVPTIEDP